MGTLGSHQVPAQGGVEGVGGGFSVHFQGIFCHLSPSLLFFVSYSFLLCGRLCSQTHLCHLRLIGRKESGRLEEVLTNREGSRGPGLLQKGPAWRPEGVRALPGSLATAASLSIPGSPPQPWLIDMERD